MCSSLSSAMQHALTLVFVETKRGADVLEGWLLRSGFSAVAIHGDKVQMVCMFYLPFISSFVIRVPSSLMPYRYRFIFIALVHFYVFLPFLVPPLMLAKYTNTPYITLTRSYPSNKKYISVPFILGGCCIP